MRKSKWRAREYKRRSAWSYVTGLAVALALILTGMTFAALQSPPAGLTGNTIETATAGLQLSTDGTTYGSSLSGFDFADIVPGGSAVPQSGYAVWLHNEGTSALSLKLAVTSVPSNPDNVDLSKVSVIITPNNGATQSVKLQTLIDSSTTGGVTIGVPTQLFAGNTAVLSLKVSLDSDAFAGSSASLGNIDFTFTGVAQ